MIVFIKKSDMNQLKSFVLFFVILIHSNSYSQNSSKEILYAELVTYRTKQDRTLKYYRTLNLLRDSYIEKWSPSILDSRIIKSNSQANKLTSEAISLLGMVPGKIGYFTKGVRIFDYGSKILADEFGSNISQLSIQDIDADIEKLTRQVYNFAQKDKKFAKVVNRYLGDDIADIRGTEKEILENYKPFFNEKQLIEIGENVKKNTDSDQDIKKILNELEAKVRSLGQESFEKDILSLQEFRAYSTIISKLVRIRNPKLGSQLSIVLNGTFRYAEIKLLAKNNKMSQSLATANYVILGLNLAESIFGQSGGSNINTVILEQLRGLQELLVSHTEEILKNLSILEEKLNTIQKTLLVSYDQLKNNSQTLSQLHKKTNSLKSDLLRKDNHILNLLSSLIAQNLKKSINEAVGYKTLFDSEQFLIEKDVFNSLVNDLNFYASSLSMDHINAGKEQRSYDSENLLDELLYNNQLANMSFIQESLSKRGAKLPSINFNVDIWLLSSSALFQLITDHPMHQKVLLPNAFQEVINKGNKIINFTEACSFRKNDAVYRNILKDIVIASLESGQDFGSRFIKNFRENVNEKDLLRSSNISLDAIREIKSARALCTMFDKMDVLSMPLTAHFVDGTWGTRKISSHSLGQLVDSRIKALVNIGILKLSAHLDYQVKHGIEKIRKYDLKIYAEYINTGEKHIITTANHNYYKKQSGGLIVISSPMYSRNMTPQSVITGVLQFFENEKLYRQQESVIEALFEANKQKVLTYFLSIKSKSLNQLESASYDYENNLANIKGLVELLAQAIFIGHNSLFDSENEIIKLLYGYQSAPNLIRFDEIFTSKSILDFENELYKWKTSVLSILEADSIQRENLPFPSIPSVVNNFVDLHDHISKKEPLYSAYAIERDKKRISKNAKKKSSKGSIWAK